MIVRIFKNLGMIVAYFKVMMGEKPVSRLKKGGD
jgi:hypothetical protein